jgi:hypothetical protein
MCRIFLLPPKQPFSKFSAIVHSFWFLADSNKVFVMKGGLLILDWKYL